MVRRSCKSAHNLATSIDPCLARFVAAVSLPLRLGLQASFKLFSQDCKFWSTLKKRENCCFRTLENPLCLDVSSRFAKDSRHCGVCEASRDTVQPSVIERLACAVKRRRQTKR